MVVKWRKKNAADDSKREPTTSVSSRRSKERKKPLEANGQKKSSTQSRKASNGSAIGSGPFETSKTSKRSSADRSMRRYLNDLLNKALRLRNRKNFRQAIDLIKHAVSEFPPTAAAYGLMAGIYLYELAEPSNAAPNFAMAVQLSPRSESASLGLFHALWELGFHEAAKREMRRFRAVAESVDYDAIWAELKEKGHLP
jgi:tetratricopeptide (TPR) repeat protein